MIDPLGEEAVVQHVPTARFFGMVDRAGLNAGADGSNVLAFRAEHEEKRDAAALAHDHDTAALARSTQKEMGASRLSHALFAIRSRMRLSSYPYVIVRIACTRCSRSGSYRLARLADRYGAEIELPWLMEHLAGDCKLREKGRMNIYDRCGAKFVDLVSRKPADDPARG